MLKEDIKSFVNKENREKNNQTDIFDKVIDSDISLVVLWGVSGVNPNGSPSDGMPRHTRDNDGLIYGSISQVSINRRIRSALPHICSDIRVFVEEAGKNRSAEDVVLGVKDVPTIIHAMRDKNNQKKGKGKAKTGDAEESTESAERSVTAEAHGDQIKVADEMDGTRQIIEKLCTTFLDLHFFGMTNIISEDRLKSMECEKGGSIILATSGPVKFSDAKSLNPLEIDEFGITKSYNGIDDGKTRSSDTMGGAFYKVKGNIYYSHLFISEGTAQTYNMTYGDLFFLMAALSETYRHDFSANRNSGIFYMGQVVSASSSNIFDKIETNSLSTKVLKVLRKKFKDCGCDVFGFSEAFELTEDEGFKKAENLAVLPKVGETLFYKPKRL